MVEQLKRKINYEIYLAALSFTLIFFILGIFTGNYIAHKKASNLDISQKDILARIELLNADKSYICNLSWGDLWEEKVESGKILTSLENRLGKDNWAVLEEKKIYNDIQINTLSKVSEYKEKCDPDWKIILFFYTNKEMIDGDPELSNKQGYMLTTVYNIDMAHVKVFAFDINTGNEGVSKLIERYNLTYFPSLVIDNKVYNGLKSTSEILDIL
jgi:hypothetical protein